MSVTDQEVARALKQDIDRINQLCAMVNHFADKLGLGKKVNAEDWTDNAEAMLKSVKGGVDGRYI